MNKIIPFIKLFWPFGIGIVLLWIPLLRDLHLESALLTATLVCFWGSLKASDKTSSNDFNIISELSLKILLLALPLLIHGAFSQCLSWTGVGLWLLLPFPSLLFGVSIGRFVRIMKFPIPKILSFCMLVLIGFGILLYEFLTLPQVYYFNHVWGFWPGPIYDDEIQITIGLIWFRLTTMSWIFLLWVLPNIKTKTKHHLSILISCVCIASIFYLHPQLGISTPREYLKTQLPEVIRTDHFVLYFDQDNFDHEERAYWAARHEFHFQQIIQLLEIDWPQDRIIESYVYANAWQKKKLVGAKFTSYVPVWLEQDQMHIAKEHLEHVLKHELVHVITKQFGNAVINASWSIGLVEGVAEAIAKDASKISTLDQIIAAEDPLPTVNEMASSLTMSGFYSSASAISYTTAGSFVGYLLENYPIKNFKVAFPTTDFEKAYNVPFDTLVTRWKSQLPVNNVDSIDTKISQQIFSQRSLFQMDCPRKVHPVLSGIDDLRLYESLSDSVNARAIINHLYSKYPDIPQIKTIWSTYQLRTLNSGQIISDITDSDSTFSLQLTKADAYFQTGNYIAADSILFQWKTKHAYKSNNRTDDSFVVRSDSLTWSIFLKARYHNTMVHPTLFETLPEPLQWLQVHRAISLKDKNHLINYARFLLTNIPNVQRFDTQESMINTLVYYREFELAEKWIHKLTNLAIRERYKERVHELHEWLDFTKATQN